MPRIILSTLNAKYAHCSLALRCLYANLGELQEEAEIQEYIWNERACDLAEKILETKPEILGLGVYIWNAVQTLELVRILKSVAPSLVIVLGGPEVSYEYDEQELTELADYTVIGEGDLAFAEICRQIVVEKNRPEETFIKGGEPKLAELVSPYSYYTDKDISERSIYVEASRGCPFRCEFCLSSLDLAVRQFPLDAFLADMQMLIDKGARQFKFIDRTFNLNPRISSSILHFFLERMDLGLFVHFEMVPDRLPRALRDLLGQFPAGSIQFEIGIQTFDPDTATRISRKQDLGRLEDNFKFLRSETKVHVHADLIIGLPGEDEASFARGFNRLFELDPDEIQVGVLKRLRGTSIIRHDIDYSVVYSKSPPYEILQSSVLPFLELARLKRFARAWDLVSNRGNFQETKLLLWKDTTPFDGFMAFSEWLFDTVGHFTGIALDRMMKLLLQYLSECTATPLTKLEVAQSLSRDYLSNRPRLPSYLAEITGESTRFRERKVSTATPKRQARHL